ncbi:hypothetical protein [Streptomyces glebosus]|uniref:hypothetical protein n=1 Tax=Streptomyces glebosus TaxID=249580 RepID=UPI00167EECF9|nr:hypothetical protein [Streptomyces glebosus]
MTNGDEPNIKESVEHALSEVENHPAEIKTAVAAGAAAGATAVSALGAAIPPPSPLTAGRLWMTLVLTLCVILVVDLLAIIYALVDKRDTDVLVGIFTTALSGLLGLFIRPPANG